MNKIKLSKRVISLLIALLILNVNSKSQVLKNVFYVLSAPKVCTACLNAYGDLLMKLDNRFDLVFVYNNQEPLSVLQLKQKTKNLYLINRQFSVLQSDSLYKNLYNLIKLKDSKKEKVSSLFYNDGKKTKFIAYVDDISDKIETINACYKETINLQKIKLNIQDEIIYSCPNCFMNIINDTFFIGNNYLNKINVVPLTGKTTSNTNINKIDLLNDKNYFKIYKEVNNDTLGYSEFKKMPFTPLISINHFNIENSNYVSMLYYSAKIDSNIVKPGGVNYGLLKITNDDIKLVPIKFKDKNKSIQLYNFIDGNDDTLIFITTYHDGYPINNDYFLANFKKYDDDSIVFISYLKEYKYNKNAKDFQPILIPILRNNWLISFSNNKIYNIKNKKSIKFDLNELVTYALKNERYKLNKKVLSWIDFTEYENYYKLLFNDKKKIFSLLISKNNGMILNLNSYSFFNEKNPNTSYIFEYNNSYYYLSLDSILSKISFK